MKERDKSRREFTYLSGFELRALYNRGPLSVSLLSSPWFLIYTFQYLGAVVRALASEKATLR